MASSASSALGRGLKGLFSSKSMSRGSSSNSRGSRSRSQRSLENLSAPIIQLILNFPLPPPETPAPVPPLSQALYALSELPCTAEWFLGTPSQTIIPLPDLPSTATIASEADDKLDRLPPLVAQLLAILDASLKACFPGDVEPDDDQNRKRLDRLLPPGSDLDSELTPIFLLLRKCVIGDEQGRTGRGLRTRLLSDSM